ncbi:hypothetical protein N7510_005008 [Penicillium lagena]|uniref:uncharacterized protein n=1 Tax=Penicillium lagena TaxID=94218 RepID=UPI0025403450|nr:uncharacterized protein N7510_005008 [Penicillium lagena]KAJ5621024.1 hypothetical protein N7510_005008 [Penicillium lagena]
MPRGGKRHVLQSGEFLQASGKARGWWEGTFFSSSQPLHISSVRLLTRLTLHSTDKPTPPAPVGNISMTEGFIAATSRSGRRGEREACRGEVLGTRWMHTGAVGERRTRYPPREWPRRVAGIRDVMGLAAIIFGVHDRT